ncbi:GGDEF domain-containing protein [Cupriavidus pinatubonensis]|uniref:GGDEF domain-containing protein n=1 Tax=Cupriavidus pinatubonensis TaxID=248026 RepID=UPI002096E447|nr:GGDEF domain-containing protein [Cupriavidus pinatubonensis]
MLNAITKNIRRPGDFVGRYGGEEFSVLLPSTDMNGAIKIAENIRAAVMATELTSMGAQPVPLSVSIGVATFDGKSARAESSEQLLRQADRRLYQAKAAGRNTIMPRQAHGQAAIVGDPHPST